MLYAVAFVLVLVLAVAAEPVPDAQPIAAPDEGSGAPVGSGNGCAIM